MSIKGTITQTGPVSEPKGQYAVRYQDITISAQDGDYFGTIGSKNGYNIGAPLEVNIENKTDQNNKPYNYFKRVDPNQQKYQNQGQQQQRPVPQEQYQQPAQQQQTYQPVAQQPMQPARPTPQAQGRDFDKENHGKCFTVLTSAVLQAGIDPQVMLSDLDMRAALANLSTVCMNSYAERRAIPLAGQGQTVPLKGNAELANAEMNNEPTQNDDSIPF